MYELDITDFFNSECPSDYCASVAEIGRSAGTDTWTAAIEASDDWDFIKENAEIRQELRDHFKEYGAWSEDEINAWSDSELNALLIQDISGTMRDYLGALGENADAWDWKEYQKQSENGNLSGRLFGGPLSDDGRVYFTIGE